MTARKHESPVCRGSYVVSTVPRSRGDLLAIEPGGAVAPRRFRGEKCWELFAGGAGPCPGCPTFELAPGRARTVVLEERSGPFTVVHVERGERTARVTAISIPDSVLAGLVRDKLRRLANAAGLSEKERRVLDLVFLGRRNRDVAAALGISERTVKFHVTNLLKKLSADSRFDLARKLLWEWEHSG